MTRVGMRLEARHVESYRYDGEWADRLVFAVLAREWTAASGRPVLDGPRVDGPRVDGPRVDGQLVNGPLLNGPLVNGPLLNGPLVNGPLVNGPRQPEHLIRLARVRG